MDFIAQLDAALAEHTPTLHEVPAGSTRDLMASSEATVYVNRFLSNRVPDTYAATVVIHTADEHIWEALRNMQIHGRGRYGTIEAQRRQPHAWDISGVRNGEPLRAQLKEN